MLIFFINQIFFFNEKNLVRFSINYNQIQNLKADRQQYNGKLINQVQKQKAMDQYQNAYKKEGWIFKKRPPYTSMPNRSIRTNDPDLQVCDNSIKTSKYTFYNFVPLNLFVQFSKVANIYFLIIGVMQMIDSISISGGFPVIFIPLSIVVGVSAFKDFYQDLKRKNSDAQINNKNANKLTAEGFKDTRWADLRIGDVIKVHKNQFFPADVILLQSSQDKLNCFIQTMNLDGQTNLKYKQVKYQFGSLLKGLTKQNEKSFYCTRQQFKYERPNPFIHTFTGSWKGTPLDSNNVVLRGCSLKITDWVSGLVVYTGVDSKIMLNSNKTRQKKSRLQFKMGIIVASIFLTQMSITLLSAFLSVLSKSTMELNLTVYLTFIHRLFIRWGSWILLFTNFVPISLIVSLEMVKYIQGINISQSHYNTTNPAQVIVQTSSLNQQLGQIQHIFSDKTGTLTKNHMNFKYMTIGTQTYGYDNHKSPIPKTITNVDFHDEKFLKYIKQKNIDEILISDNNQIYDMMIMFSLCHNVIIQKDEKTGEQRYNASSPDQLAFINMAKLCNFEYIGVNQTNQLCVKRINFKTSKQELIKYKILHIIQFNSDRKRMTVILEKDNRVYVYCKGADNVIIERLKHKDTKISKTVNERIQYWSIEGLRTLLFAKRQIRKEDYQKWAKMYAYSLSRLEKIQKIQNKKLKKQFMNQLSTDSTGRSIEKKLSFESMGKMIIDHESLTEQKLFSDAPEVIMNSLLNDNLVLSQNQKMFVDKYLDNMDSSTSCSSAQLEDILEKQLFLIGSTAIQDKLQDNVKPTIQNLRKAGIKVWMLTGDKKQTAVNIGKSCGLIQEDMAILYWGKTVQQTLQQRKAYPPDRQCCLVATGNDLLVQMDESILLKLVQTCKSIICCRVTPKQKQDMVWLMRKNKCTTLGIGDGANDVNMINTAHVGVGIKGVEGAQAALCSDYAISEFQILGELMLYHGRQSYRKNSQLILFNFYKNLLLVLPQFWFGFGNSFSSATIYDPWIYQLYNVFFTSFPIVVYAIFDQKHSKKQSMRDPELYKTGLNNELFNFRSVVVWFIEPIIFSFFLNLINFQVLEQSINSKGYMFDMLSSGMCIFAQCVIVSNLKVIILSHVQSFGLYLVCILSIAMFYLISYLAQKAFYYGDSVNAFYLSTTTLGYWACIVANVSLIIIYEQICKTLNDIKYMQKQTQEKLKNEIEMPMITEVSLQKI